MAEKINQIELNGITYDLQDKDAKAPFTGTKVQVQLAIAEGKIKEGDIVNITDDINDYPGGGGDYPSGASNIVYLTQEQYDALPDDKLSDDIEYRIMDEGFEATAINIGYDNSKSGLFAETLQEAVDELSRRPGGGGGESNIVYLTQEQYDDLPDSKLTDGVEYRVTDAGVRGSAENVSYDGSASGLNAKNVQEAVDAIAAGAGNAENVEYLTQAQYDELGEEKLSNGIEYRITDAGTPTTASNVGFDGTASGIDAVNVQGAIDAVNNSLEWRQLYNPEPTLEETTTSYVRTYTVDYSNYREIEITLLVQNYAAIDKRVIAVPIVSNPNLPIYDYKIYIKDENNFTWIGCVKLGHDKKTINVYTAKNSHSPTEYPITMTYLLAR